MNIRANIAGLKAAFKEIVAITYAKVFGYYKHIDFLPTYNWFELMKGNFKFLYKIKVGFVPRFFTSHFEVLFYQLEKVKMDKFEDNLKLAYLRSFEVTAKTKAEKYKYLNKANFFEAQIEAKKSQNKEEDKDINASVNATRNEMTTLIEETFNSIGSIDVHKIKTSRFFSLYHRALDKRANTQ